MSEIRFDNDKALIIANQLMSSDIDYKWAIQNPLWFIAVRDEDVLRIHDKIWSKKRGSTFAQYADELRKIELTLCSDDNSLNKSFKLIKDSTDMRCKFYRYYLTTLFTPGLRLVDVEKKKMHCWNSVYFTQQKFKNVFEKSLDSRKIREFALLQPYPLSTQLPIDPYKGKETKLFKSRIPNLINEVILNQLIVDKQLLKSPACKPLRYVFAIGWKEQDRLLDKHHYKV